MVGTSEVAVELRSVDFAPIHLRIKQRTIQQTDIPKSNSQVYRQKLCHVGACNAFIWHACHAIASVPMIASVTPSDMAWCMQGKEIRVYD